ncbi:MAG: 16S rRNA (guanine(966)-N(2))-methyltransferase RsmD [Bacillota bacterium]
MRVIAGSAKGHRLKSLKGDNPRPTSDLVRGALFNTLREFVVDRAWLDLFAGTGAIGIEALSRGATRAFMVEEDPRCQRVIQENLDNTGLSAAGVVFRGRVEHGLRWLEHHDGAGFDVIFVDPPYGRGLVLDTVRRLAAKPSLLAAGGVIVVQHSRSEPIDTLPTGLVKSHEASYGHTVLSYLRRPDDS